MPGAPVEATPVVGKVSYKASSYQVSRVTINASSSGSNTLVALTAGKKIIVMQYLFERADPVTITIQSSGGRVLLGPCGPSVRGGGMAPPFCPVGHFETDVGEALIMSLSGAVQVGGSLVFILV